MRVSEHYGLGLEQPSLDFVDVRLETDTELFIDPTALNLLDTPWGAQSRSLIQDYFSLVLKYIKEGDHARARQLLAALNEPNETRLGYSSDKPRGHGMGKKLAVHMWRSLRESAAVSSGIVQDLEDTALLIDGIASDVISDIVTNIIREPLLEYTQAMCEEYGIPMQHVSSRPIWDGAQQRWITKMTDQPVVDGKRLLLVPKTLVRRNISYEADEYYNLYLLERLQEEAANEGFVRLLKNGEVRPPTKKSLKEQHGEAGKAQNRRLTPTREDVLEKYRKDKQENPREPLSHGKIAEITHTPEPDWDDMLKRLTALPPGTKHAKEYEDIIKEIFTALFYPWLMYPKSQERVHDGRKIIDVTYMNMAEGDFFNWLANHYPAQYIIVECKNYAEDIDNPALDQLSGRFSPRRGRFGLLVSRTISDKQRIAQKCRDTADDDRGFIVCLDDEDIAALIQAVRVGSKDAQLSILRDRFDRLVM